MPSNVAFPLFSQPFLDASGRVTRPWAQFLQALVVRVGQDRAMTNLELEGQVEGVESVAETRDTANEILQAFTPTGPMASLEAMGLVMTLFSTPPGGPPPGDLERLFDDRGTQGFSPGLTVRKNSTTTIGTRRQVNLIEGDSVTLTLVDDGSEIDVTIAVKGTPATYTATNVTTDRSYDADATTLAEVADILGTLIADLRARGLVL